ncbi:hypothetical protein FHX74_003488 [Friedmanniella endophytica]|uniref:DUF3097 domain-containing protein n=1 Tax=Microlunatus kandeliicorticis TaxID=1759536 RepID=A0A7W3IV78_9ACTN|nr:DUF3097 domain-containing protein [Microlunatus kandeliicorticis]MBA8795847.1 hypothetical protein [Microlunatus kandeliicorticis]
MSDPRGRQGSIDRYGSDVLAAGWQRDGSHALRKQSVDEPLAVGLVVEDATSGFCGAVVRWENGVVLLEDRHGKRRGFGIGPGFLLDGRPVRLVHPHRVPDRLKPPARDASGSVAAPTGRARTALPSRIYVEGRHDAELVEKIWGNDLRHVGVVVEYLGGVDDLPAVVEEFAPERGRRLGVLVDHLVPGSKESRIVDRLAGSRWSEFVLVTGHPFIDIWEAVRPAAVGIPAWPQVPKGTDWKHGVCAALGWPHADQADIARAWQHVLGRVNRWTDLERPLLTQVETLIDFVTQDHPVGD